MGGFQSDPLQQYPFFSEALGYSSHSMVTTLDFLRQITLPKNLTVRKTFILSQVSELNATEWELESDHSPLLHVSLIQMHPLKKNKINMLCV